MTYLYFLDRLQFGRGSLDIYILSLCSIPGREKLSLSCIEPGILQIISSTLKFLQIFSFPLSFFYSQLLCPCTLITLTAPFSWRLNTQAFKKVNNRKFVSYACALRNYNALSASLSSSALGCSRFLGRLEHTCGTKPSSRTAAGFEPITSQLLRIPRRKP